MLGQKVSYHHDLLMLNCKRASLVLRDVIFVSSFLGKTPTWFLRLEATVQRVSFCYFVTYISGAKFEEHCCNISGDILNSVLYGFGGTIYGNHFPHLHNTKTWISLKRKIDVPKGKKPLFFNLKNLSNRQQLFFYFMGALRPRTHWGPMFRSAAGKVARNRC